MWVVAVGLHRADVWAKEGRGDTECDQLPGEYVPLNLFNYTNQRMGCLMRKGFASTNFTGITVSYN